MTYSAKLSILKNFSKSLFNLKKDSHHFNFSSPKPIKRSGELTFTDKELKHFRQMIHWERMEVPPTFPYALLTHLHFSLVNDQDFPFSPFGLIHKKECIECFEPLVPGQWNMACRLDAYRKVDRGFEMDIVSELTVDGKLMWKSTTTAFKKMESGLVQKRHDPVLVTSNVRWSIPRNNGLAYGLISNNLDPIHLSKLTANLMGHKQAIMHGMWTCARGLSEFDFSYPLKVDVKFIAPIYLPAEVLYKKDEEGFGVYSSDGKGLHLLAKIAKTTL